jgi:hypothetical protein
MDDEFCQCIVAHNGRSVELGTVDGLWAARRSPRGPMEPVGGSLWVWRKR